MVKDCLESFGFSFLPTLKNAIAHGDVGLLSKAQGLGKKTAERIVVELKDKVLPKGVVVAPVQNDQGVSVSIADQSSDTSQDLSAYSDAVSALLTLGYKATDADLAVRRAAESLGGEVTTEELIRKALGR